MKKQSQSSKNQIPVLPSSKVAMNAPLPQKTVKAPAVKRSRPTSGTSTPEEEKTLVSLETSVKDGEEAGGSKPENNGHKGKKVCDVLNACHKNKFLPLADGMFTSNVYFHPTQVTYVGKNWVDVTMKELFIGADVFVNEELHVYAVEAEDFLRMMYLGSMINDDLAGKKRVSFEQWKINVFSKMIESDRHSDFTDHGKMAVFSFYEGGELHLGESTVLQFFFQKRCLYDFLEPTPEVVQISTNAMTTRSKSSRGKFEYVFELHIISLPTVVGTEDVGAMDEINEKREIEEGVPPSPLN